MHHVHVHHLFQDKTPTVMCFSWLAFVDGRIGSASLPEPIRPFGLQIKTRLPFPNLGCVRTYVYVCRLSTLCVLASCQTGILFPTYRTKTCFDAGLGFDPCLSQVKSMPKYMSPEEVAAERFFDDLRMKCALGVEMC